MVSACQVERARRSVPAWVVNGTADAVQLLVTEVDKVAGDAE
jgi:hypothetical protein